MVEWYEEMAARTRTFQFFYFSGSKSIEMVSPMGIQELAQPKNASDSRI